MPKGFKAGGRVAGTPNKATQDFRATVTSLLEKNAQNVSIWLDQVANGEPGKGIKAQPEKALDLLARLAEFAAPKLNRTEHVGDGGGPVKILASNKDEDL